MPLNEFYQVSSKPDSVSQPKIPSITDLSSSFMQDDEFVELLWENGQVVMQGQMSKPSKKIMNPFSPFQAQFQEKNNIGTNPTFSLFPKIPSFGSVDHLTETDFEPKSSIGLNSREEDDSVPWMNCSIDGSLCSELLTDLNQMDNLVENQTSKNPVSRRSVPMLKLNNTDLSNKQNKQIGSMNFSHFTRPVGKNGLQNEERLNNQKVSTSCNNNNNIPLESTVVQSSGFYEMPVLLPSFQKESLNKNTFSENKTEREKPREKPKEKSKGSEIEKAGSSSVCSGNVEPKKSSKRKSLEEDFEELDESVELRRPNSKEAGNIKRSRTAEIHNLSERRRRDRINEKMRALQELIPNCSKVDKASMLDEAIEYLKSLQQQVQMMASGAGFCMPHMMFPPGFHHMRMPPFQIPHPPFFHPVYGYGIPDLNTYPANQPPIMHGARNVINGGIPMFRFPTPVVTNPNINPDFEIPSCNKEIAEESSSLKEIAEMESD